MHRRTLLAALAAPALAAPALANAQISTPGGWPNGPIRVVVPFPPGGSVDAIARILQPHLQAGLGTSVIVENRAGASGALGAAAVARSAPDGQTFLHVFDTHAVNPALITNLGYDTMKDFTPVLLFGTAPMVITTPKARPWADFQALLAAARAKPDTITYGTIGNGSLAHLSMMLLQKAADVKLVHVPYRGGGPLVVAAAAAEVDLPTATGSIFAQQMESGALRALATTGPARVPMLPNTPTLTELGYLVQAQAFWGALAPTGTPAIATTGYAEALRTALALPEVRQRIGGVMGVDIDPKDGPAFREFLARQIAIWGKVVRENEIRPD
jgi:tripartite-type tricarboxylate transporter receptor subunit TctC